MPKSFVIPSVFVPNGSTKDNDGATCPAERLNGKRYAENWLENLLTAASLGGTKKLPPKIRNDEKNQ